MTTTDASLAPRARPAAGTRTIAWDRVVLSAVAALAVLMVCYPVLFVVLRSISKDDIGSSLSAEWLLAVFNSARSHEALINTAIYTAGSSLLAMVLGVGLSFLATRTDMPGSRFVGMLALLPMLVPPFILVVGWVAIADPSAGYLNIMASAVTGSRTVLANVNTMAGIIWVTGLFLTPYVYLLVAAGFSNSDAAVEEAARVSGAGRLRLLRTVILPLQRPALLAALLLVVIMSAGDFIIPSTIGLKARIYLLPSLIWQNSSSFPPRPGLAAAQSLLLVAVGLLCIFFQRRALSRGARFTILGGKGSSITRFPLGRLRYPLAVLALVFAFCSSLFPLLAVGSMAFMKYWAPHALKAENFTLGNFRYVLFEYPQVWPSVQHSLVLALLGATVCVALAVALAWYVLRLRGRFAALVDYAMVLPLGMPGIALGVGILSLWILVPGGIYGTLWILLLAFVTAHIPVAMQFVGSALHRIHTDLEDASRIGGQAWLGTVRRIDLPLMRPALIGCWLLMYVVILREISLVILLYNPSTVVLSVGLMDVWSSGFYPELAVYSLLLMVLGLVPVALLWKFARFTPA
ncbi:Putative 2-aminoethylphosphonate transport system permease protein PhnV [Variovorax sp. SRS16]|uniref:ABC transporter permease n=1 Tax=Variovorax sp. SRS16 TaxID=282217 RepID=UPI0013189D01|nr:iron ABC transporter permease [Variovorax sp. SRS16]VTU28183.1 Putative 2-aminoethylphosphonate transport system permease protein PhnV [Variovorax sp. SRS16]